LSGGGPEELVRTSQRLLAAIVGRDAAALEEFPDPAFVHFDAAGVRSDRAAFLAAVLASTYTVLEAGFESLSVELVEGLGVVNGVQRAEVALTDGEPVVSRSAFTDVFVPTERGWRIRVARSVELEPWPCSGKEDRGTKT